MTAVKFERVGAGVMFSVRFAYNPALVDLVKLIPGHARKWDPTGKVWTVQAHYVHGLAADMRARGCTIIGLDQPEPPTPGGGTDWASALFTRVGKARADSVFRALSKILHPDMETGDSTLQRELLEARERFR